MNTEQKKITAIEEPPVGWFQMSTAHLRLLSEWVKGGRVLDGPIVDSLLQLDALYNKTYEEHRIKSGFEEAAKIAFIRVFNAIVTNEVELPTQGQKTLRQLLKEGLERTKSLIPHYVAGDVVRLRLTADWGVNGLWEYENLWAGKKAIVRRQWFTMIQGRELYNLELLDSNGNATANFLTDLEIDYLDARIKSTRKKGNTKNQNQLDQVEGKGGGERR